jgi:dTDP-4-dehydrorhamnose reductase
MKILITGSNGLLGQHLVPQLLAHGHHIVALGKGKQRIAWQGPVDYYDLDITQSHKLRQFAKKQRPHVVVHAAAITQVDDCEKDREKSREVNVDATENLLDACSGFPAHFIFLSTDFVFDGDRGNYREEDPVNPVNWYGETKLMAEQRVAAYPGNWSIARTCLLYGMSRNSSRSTIISWIRSSLEKGETIRVVNDQVRTPTCVNDFGTGIRLILEQRATGMYHLSGEETMTPYQLALATADHFSLNKSLIREVNADTFSQPARRPLKTGFIIEKARCILGFSPMKLQEGLREMG